MPSSASSCWRGLAPTDRPLEPAVAEQADHRDALHVVLLRDRGFVVDVDLDDLVGALTHRRDRLDDRRDLAARPAPRRPEVDDHRRVALQHLAFELRGGHRRHQLDRVLGHGLVRRPPASTSLNQSRASRRLSIATWCSIGYSRYTTGTPASRNARARSRDRCTGIKGSLVPCSMSTGSACGRRVDLERVRVGHGRAHRDDARRPRRGHRAAARARARGRHPARTRRRSRPRRAKPSASHCSSTSASSSASALT